MKFDTRTRDGIIACQPGALARVPLPSLVIAHVCQVCQASRQVALPATPIHGRGDEIHTWRSRMPLQHIATRLLTESHGEEVGRGARECVGGWVPTFLKTAQGRWSSMHPWRAPFGV